MSAEILKELPSPATLKDVVQIAELYEESKSYMKSAKAKLQSPQLLSEVDWELSLYMIFCAWIVDFGLAPTTSEDSEEGSKSKQESTSYPKQRQHLIEVAAIAIDLTWIPFIDLALAPFSGDEDPPSGPFGGVFVSHGAKPFMILAFKGTTFPMEVIADRMDDATQVRPDVLYGESAHQGKSQGLFLTFTYVGEKHDAFEIIWERLHTEALKLQIGRGNVGKKIPLYVTGHSLGSGYATLAFIELNRRIGLAECTPFALYGAWAFGSGRVVLNAGAKKAMEVIQDSNRYFYRPVRHHDIVPTQPGTVNGNTYIHLDFGYKLSPEDLEGKYVTDCQSEIDNEQINDQKTSWYFHKPQRYYDAIKKVLDNQE